MTTTQEEPGTNTKANYDTSASTKKDSGIYKGQKDWAGCTRLVVCFFCCKENISIRKSKNNSAEEKEQEQFGIPEKFFKLMRRQLGPEHNFQDDNALVSLLEELPVLRQRLTSCDDCLRIISMYCDLYHEWKSVELRINWQLEKLWQVMRFADRVPSRLKAFKKWCQSDICTISSEQSDTANSGDGTCKDFLQFRNILKRKYKQLKSTSLPRVQLHRHKPISKPGSDEADLGPLKCKGFETLATVQTTLSLDSQVVHNSDNEFLNVEKQKRERLVLGWVSSLTAVIFLFHFHPEDNKCKNDLSLPSQLTLKESPTTPLGCTDDKADKTELGMEENEDTDVDMVSITYSSEDSSHDEISDMSDENTMNEDDHKMGDKKFDMPIVVDAETFEMLKVSSIPFAAEKTLSADYPETLSITPPDFHCEEMVAKSDELISDKEHEYVDVAMEQENCNSLSQAGYNESKTRILIPTRTEPDPGNDFLPRRSLRQKYSCLNCKATFSTACRLEKHKSVCQQNDDSQDMSDPNETDSDVESEPGVQHMDNNIAQEMEWNSKYYEASQSSDADGEDDEMEDELKLDTKKMKRKMEKLASNTPTERKYKCVKCSPHQEFTSKSLLKFHSSYLHTNGYTYLSTAKAASLSMKDVNLLNFPCDERCHPCPHCGKVFALPEELERHKQIHHIDQPFVCHFCNLTIASSSAVELIEHELEHSESMVDSEDSKLRRGIICGRCGVSCGLKVDFVNHYLTEHLALPPIQAKCPICGKLFNGKEQVPLVHYINYHDLNRLADPDKPFRCVDFDCTAYYLKEDQLHVHWNLTHKRFGSEKKNNILMRKAERQKRQLEKNKMVRKLHKCQRCSKLFNTIRMLRDHLWWNHGPGTTFKKSDGKSHVVKGGIVVSFPEDGITIDDIVSEKNFKFKCCIEKCTAKFKDEIDLENHSKLHGEFKCTSCDITKTFAPELSIHEMSHTTTTNFTSAHRKVSCLRCSFTSKLRWDYIFHHVEGHLGLAMDKKRCPICKMAYRSNADNLCGNGPKRQMVWRHYIDFHTIMDSEGKDCGPDSGYKCKENGCKAYFQNPSQVRLHMLEVHENVICPVEERLKCRDCGVYFSSTDALGQHRNRKHASYKANLKFLCGVTACAKRFENEEDLFNHVTVTHNREAEQIVCPKEVCGRKFWTKAGLIAHLQHIHGDCDRKRKKKRDYVCEECGKHFKEKDQLDKHKVFHDGPDSWKFSCSVCNKKISSKQKLEQHLRVHTKEKPFVCQVCGVAYAHRHNLRIHVNNKHGLQDIARKINRIHKESSRKGKKFKMNQ